MESSCGYHYATAGDRKNPSLVFLHGFMGSSSDWENVVHHFSRSYYCVSLDLPGHGGTQVARETDYAMESCAREIVSLLDSLSIEEPNVIGYSMGGRLALYLAVHYPNRFDKTVIESASPGLETEKERESRVESDKVLAERIAGMPMAQFIDEWYAQPLFATLDKSSPAYRKMIERRLANNAEKLGLSLKMMGTGAQASLWERLDEIKSRVLLIVGECDTKFSQVADRIVERCPSASIASVDGAGHNAHLEKPEEYIEQVRLFLES